MAMSTLIVFLPCHLNGSTSWEFRSEECVSKMNETMTMLRAENKSIRLVYDTIYEANTDSYEWHFYHENSKDYQAAKFLASSGLLRDLGFTEQITAPVPRIAPPRRVGKCFKCLKEGHWAADCPRRERYERD